MKVERKAADVVAEATIELLRPYKDHVLTITADRGKEFAYHEMIAKMLECEYYFAPSILLLGAWIEFHDV